MFAETMLLGNVGTIPTVRDAGTSQVCTFRVAVNRRWTGRDGQPAEETTWFSIEAWGKLAESTGKYLTKGRQVFIKGRLKPDKETGGPVIWAGAEGKAQASFVLVAERVDFLGPNPNAAAVAATSTQPVTQPVAA